MPYPFIARGCHSFVTSLTSLWPRASHIINAPAKLLIKSSINLSNSNIIYLCVVFFFIWIVAIILPLGSYMYYVRDTVWVKLSEGGIMKLLTQLNCKASYCQPPPSQLLQPSANHVYSLQRPLSRVLQKQVHSQKELAHWTVNTTAQIYVCYLSGQLRCNFSLQTELGHWLSTLYYGHR